MVKAYIFIEMVAGHARDMVAHLKGHGSIIEINRVTGPYDVIVVLQADDLGGISDIVSTDIHSIKGVSRTTTCVCLE